LDFFGPLWDGLRGFDGGEHGFDLRRLQLRRAQQSECDFGVGGAEHVVDQGAQRFDGCGEIWGGWGKAFGRGGMGGMMGEGTDQEQGWLGVERELSTEMFVA